MIRVLQVIHSMNLGGAENFIMNIYREVDRTEIQFDFLVNTPGAFDEEIIEMGGKIWQIPYVNTVGPFRYRRELMKFFSQHPEYQIVHSHLNMVSGEVVECAKKAGVSLCITHSHTTNLRGNTAVKLLKKYYQKKIPKYADVCMACSKEAGQWLYHNDEAVIIKNAIDVRKFSFQEEYRTEMRRRFDIPEDAFVIGHVGRFDRVKNHRFLVEIFEIYLQKHSNAVLLLCGDGPEKEGIKKSVTDKMMTDYVIFYNVSPEVYKMYSAMDMFVFPSLYEGMGIALLEAQANGLPIVVSNTIPSQGILTDYVKSFSLDADIEEWIGAIEECGKSGRYNGEKIVKAAGYDVRECVDTLLQYYGLHKGTNV